MKNTNWHDPATATLGNRHFSARFGGSAIAVAGQPRHAVRIHLTHACPILRIGIATVLAGQPGMEVVDEAAQGAEVRKDDIVITDYTSALHCIKRHGARPRVLIVTSKDKEWEVRHAVEHGVHGYLLQSCIPDELIRSVHLLSRGVAYLSASLKRSVADSLGRAALTLREIDVLRLLARGDSNKVIARELGIGVVTVRTHVAHLLEKLDATARTHAVAVAIDRGLLQGGSD